MKLSAPSGGIQQTGASEVAAKNVTPCFGYWLQALKCTFVFHYHKLPQEEASGKGQPWYEFSTIYTVHNAWVIVDN